MPYLSFFFIGLQAASASCFWCLISVIACSHAAAGQSIFTVQQQTLLNGTQCAPFSMFSSGASGVLFVACDLGVISIYGGSSTHLTNSTQCLNSRGVYYDTATAIVYATCYNGVISISGYGVDLLFAAQCTSIHGNPLTGDVFVTCGKSVVLIRGTTVTTVASTVGNAISVFSGAKNGTAYVASDDGILFVDGTNVTSWASTVQCSSPEGVYYAAATGVVYAACNGNGIISIHNNVVTTVIPMSQILVAHGVYGEDGIVYAAGDWGIFSISGESITQFDGFRLCQSVFASGGTIFPICSRSNGVISLTTVTTTVLATVAQCPWAESQYIDPKTGGIYAACRDNGLVSIFGNLITKIASSLDCPRAMSVSSNGAGIVYALCGDSSPLSLISISGSIITTMATFPQCHIAGPDSVHCSASTGVVYVACDHFLFAVHGGAVTTLFDSSGCTDPARQTDLPTVDDLFFAYCTYGLVQVRGLTVTTIATTGTCPGPTSAYLNTATGVVFATCSGLGVISIVGSVVQVIVTLGQCSNPQTVTNSGKFTYAACDGGVVTFDGAKVTTSATLLHCSASQLLFGNVAGGILYSGCETGLSSVYGTSVTTFPFQIQNANVPLAFDSAYKDAAIVVVDSIGFYLIRGSNFITLADGSSRCRTPRVVINRVTAPGLITAICGNGGIGSVVSFSVDQNCPIGYYFADVTGPGCSPCLPGSFRNLTMVSERVVSCQACAVGSVMPVSGGAQCQICPASQYAVSSSVPCANCSLGMYSSDPGSVACELCKAGYFGSAPGLNDTCSGPCSAGYWCSAGSTSPTQIRCGSRSVFCPIGSNSPVPVKSGMWTTESIDGSEQTMSAQLPCPVGSYCDGSGIFKPCLLGTFQNQTNQSSCLPCSPGTISGSGATNCTICPEGHTSAAESSVCTPCAPGTYLNLTSAVCVKCSIGSFSNSAAGSCTPCPPGQIANSPGSAFCQSCPSGQSNQTDTVTRLAICVECLPGFASTGGAACFPCAVGYYAAVAGSVTCIPCSPGSFSNTSGSNYCHNCTAGRFSADGAATTCLSCNPGTFSDLNAAFCAACNPGFAPNSSTCEPCGRGSSSPGGEPCTLCEIGHYSSHPASPSCTPCSPGTFASELGSFECTNCTAGRYAETGAASACLSCSFGTFSTTGAAFCIGCSPGYAPSNASTISACEPCPPGSASSDGTKCSPCPSGQVAAATGSAFCQQCDPGTTPVPDPLTNILLCSVCPVGTSSQGGRPCTPCLPASFASNNGSFSCTLCAQGTASNETGLTRSCPLCPPGTYQSSTGQSECIACPAQHYAASEGAISCQLCTAQVSPNRTQCKINTCAPNYVYSSDDGQCNTCPLGSAGTGDCQTCDAGYYTPSPGTSCTPCTSVEGLICSGGLASVDVGYWAYLLPANDAGIQLYATAPCPPGYCPGSRLQQINGSLDATIEFCTFPRINSPSNILCGECVPGYIPWGSGCAECPGINGGLVLGLIIVSFVLVLFLLRSSGSSAGMVTVLLYFVQISALEIGFVSQWFSWLRIFNFSSSSVSACVGPWTPYEQTLFSLFIPIILEAEVAFIACMHLVLRNHFRKHPSADLSTDCHGKVRQMISKLVAKFSWNQYIGGAMAVLLFCYTQVATSCMQFLYCIDAGTHLVMFTSPTVNCRSTEYHSFQAYVLLVLSLYIVGFPLAMVVLLWKYRAVLTLSLQRVEVSSQALTIFQRWGPLYAMYEPQDAWFWQALVLLRRAVFALIAALLVQKPAISFMLFAIIHFISLMLHVFVQPYGSIVLNRTETISNAVLVLVSMLLTGYHPPYPTFIQAFVLILVVPPGVVLAAIVVRQQWRELKQKLKPRAASHAASVEMHPAAGSIDPSKSRPVAPIEADLGQEQNPSENRPVEGKAPIDGKDPTMSEDNLLAPATATSDSVEVDSLC